MTAVPPHVRSSHYSDALRIGVARNKIDEAVDEMEGALLDLPLGPDAQSTAPTPLLVYSGMSGIAFATYVAQNWHQRTGWDCGMIYVRKPDEKSHGDAIEFAFDTTKCYAVVFVDDLTETGQTRMFCMDQLREAFAVHKTLRDDLAPIVRTDVWYSIFGNWCAFETHEPAPRDTRQPRHPLHPAPTQLEIEVWEAQLEEARSRVITGMAAAMKPIFAPLIDFAQTLRGGPIPPARQLTYDPPGTTTLGDYARAAGWPIIQESALPIGGVVDVTV